MIERVRDWLYRANPEVNHTLECISVLKGLDRGYQTIHGQIVLTGYGFCGSIASAYGEVLPNKFSKIKDLQYILMASPFLPHRQLHVVLGFTQDNNAYILDGTHGQVKGVCNRSYLFSREQLFEVFNPISIPSRVYDKAINKGTFPKSYQLTKEGLIIAPFTGEMGHQDRISINGQDITDKDLIVQTLNKIK